MNTPFSPDLTESSNAVLAEGDSEDVLVDHNAPELMEQAGSGQARPY